MRLADCLRPLAVWVGAVALCSCVHADTPLFDGRTLAGWEGDPRWWRVEGGALTGGSRTEKVPRNFFLVSRKTYQNFDLRLWLKLVGVPDTGLINSGVQIRSMPGPGPHELCGYQVDAGDGWWGKLYDESRRRSVIAEAADMEGVNAAVRRGNWNEYRILAEGPRIRSWINGVPAIDYTETEPRIPQDGHLGIQIHSGGIALVQVKDITIQELPPTPNAPTWETSGRPRPQPRITRDGQPAPAAPIPAPAGRPLPPRESPVDSTRAYPGPN